MRPLFGLQLDEWRLWNGVRSRTEIIELMQRPLNPRLEDSYGDPTRITGTGTAVSAAVSLSHNATWRCRCLLLCIGFLFCWSMYNPCERALRKIFAVHSRVLNVLRARLSAVLHAAHFFVCDAQANQPDTEIGATNYCECLNPLGNKAFDPEPNIKSRSHKNDN